jgi:hypothetical protein
LSKIALDKVKSTDWEKIEGNRKVPLKFMVFNPSDFAGSREYRGVCDRRRSSAFSLRLRKIREQRNSMVGSKLILEKCTLFLT